MSSKRELRSSGSTTGLTLDQTKTYKYDSTGALVESTGTPADTDILFSGSKSSLRRISDLERNVSILAARTQTDDGSGSGTSGKVDYATKAGQWITSRTITLGGDLTGNVSINGTSDVTLSATIAANSVALGTDTTGNYMVNVSGGTGISVSHTQGEGSTATISLNATTDNVSEGSTNQYFTTARARSAVSASGSLSYNSSTGVFSYTTPTTSGITEGTNLYYTDARARAAVSAGTGISYNSTTGAISTSSIPNASLANSTVTVTAGSGMSGGGTAALGGTVTLTNAGVTSNVAGAGISVSGATGAVTITNTGVTSAVAGTGVSVSAATGPVTFSIGQPVSTTSNVTFNDLTVSGNLTVTGTTTSINTTTLDVVDSNITIAKNAATATAANGAGLTVNGPTTPATLTYTSADDRWNLNKNLNVGTVYGALSGNATSATTATTATTTTGNAGTATTLQTARLINGVSFNGSADVTVTTAGTGISVSGTTVTNTGVTSAAVSGTGLSINASTGGVTITSNATNLNTASTVVARDASGNFTAGTITAALSGNASTATTATNVSGGTVSATTGSFSSTVATGALTVTGAITATGEVTAYFSDLRLKTNIVPIADALDKVEAINGVTFDPNEDALALGIDNRHQMGVIAQEIEAVAPELVCDSAFAGYKTVRYDKLTALLIEAVKELSAKVKTLEAQLGGTKPQL